MSKGSQKGKDLAKLKRQVLDLERKKRESEYKLNSQQNKISTLNDIRIQNKDKR